MNIDLYRETYGTYVREALGRNKNADLSMCCFREPTPDSDTYKIPSWKMKDKDPNDTRTFAKRGKTRDIYTRDDFEKLPPAQRTMEEFLKMRTPHQELKEFYTISTSQTVKGGHQFSDEKKLVMGNDPTSRTCTAIAQMIFDQRQDIFLEALTGQTVQRQVGTNVSSVTLPAAQTYETEKVGFLDVKEDYPRLKAKFKKANVPDTTNIWGIINTDDAALMEVNSFEKIYNWDYVHGEHLRTGSIPDMFGIKWITSNLIPSGSFYLWLYDAISWVPYAPLAHDMDKSAGDSFDVFFQIKESCDAQRVDDLGVVHGTIKQP